ncbi:transposase, partial [Anaplasma marginale]|uniref:transposase n=1 Tax=Anaplasma marginale TaxID=770 RepID=UPI0018E97EC2
KIDLSERQIRRVLKKYRWKRTRKSIKGKQDLLDLQTKKNDLEMLEFAAAAGEICLKYLDESGFSLWSEVVYTWAKIGKQKRIEQSKKKGKRLNICGLLEPNKSFKYGLALKSFNSKSFIKLIDWQAKEASQRL